MSKRKREATVIARPRSLANAVRRALGLPPLPTLVLLGTFLKEQR